MNNIKYTTDGRKVLVLGNLNQEKIVQEIYIVDGVEILGNANQCKNFDDWPKSQKNIAGKHYEIYTVNDNAAGLSYTMRYDTYTFPHYCVRKVENPPKQMTQAQIEQELGYKVKIID